MLPNQTSLNETVLLTKCPRSTREPGKMRRAFGRWQLPPTETGETVGVTFDFEGRKVQLIHETYTVENSFANPERA